MSISAYFDAIDKLELARMECARTCADAFPHETKIIYRHGKHHNYATVIEVSQVRDRVHLKDCRGFDFWIDGKRIVGYSTG